MAIFVNNRSALRFWSLATVSLDEVTRESTITCIRGATSSLAKVREDDLEAFGGGSYVVHLAVVDAGQRRKTRRIVTHLRSAPYPQGAFRRYARGVYVASPELCFLEAASFLSFFQLVKFGFLICGTYTLNPDAEELNCRPSFTNKRKILSFIDRMGTTRSCRVAKRALELVAEGSASPRETETAILLAAPSRMGGYGFELPRLNYRIDFTEDQRRMFGRQFVVLDLYWPQFGVAIEYDGEDGHSAFEDVARDRRKSSEMAYLGITVVRVDKRQMANAYQVQVLARKCARLMGRYMRKMEPDQMRKKEALFDAVMRRSS